MTNAFLFLRVSSVRWIASWLVLLLVSAPLALPCAALSPANSGDELPPAPSARLRLQGTLASMNVAPSKLDQGPAQTPAPPPPALQIAILEGEDVSNNIKERTAREPIVQVTDENHKPVGGAVVLFSIQSGTNHAGASFLHGAKTYTGTTDAEGKVTARGFHPNGHAGQFHVNVTASKGQLKSQSVIAQTNIAAAAAASSSTGTIPGFIATHAATISLVAGAVVLGGVVSSIVVTNPNLSTTIATGPGAVGPPQAAIRLHSVHR